MPILVVRYFQASKTRAERRIGPRASEAHQTGHSGRDGPCIQKSVSEDQTPCNTACHSRQLTGANGGGEIRRPPLRLARGFSNGGPTVVQFIRGFKFWFERTPRRIDLSTD